MSVCRKKQISAGAAAPNATVEIVKDITLGKGECLIETEGGIFDCDWEHSCPNCVRN